ncbi:glutaredoxin family protein [Bifidobacterium eulemuris]|uniref:Glutaredoxin-like protein NrdH n=1 Tax=Bifidobacterium eulemuris TaxID=1765219 RepID=A0A261G040_9BIFI|nr:glutaredoxin family protein [Bifidobacterium eulemuris]OZG64767.1 NrdH-redoxin [Bifidobacterium eulemuris]QOL32510.1 glutaredoxin family protein [Bifidobacterium eulemuris]
MAVTVYSKPSCPQCDATKRQLTALGVPFAVVDVTQDAQAAELLRTAGFMQVPVVLADNDIWSGYRPDKIKQLAATAGANRREPATI